MLVTVSVLAACAGNKKHKYVQMSVIQATSQSWSGGPMGSGFGTNYVVLVGYNGTGEIQFDTLWIGARAFVPGIIRQGGSVYKLTAKYTSRPRRDPETGQVDESQYIEDPEKSDHPPKYDGEGLLIYHAGGKRTTQLIKEFEKKQQLNYP